MTCAYNITTSGRSSDTTTGYALDSVLGANTWNGSIVQNGSGGACGIVSGVGTLTINGNVGGSGGNRYIDFAGAGNITVNGNITNSSGYTLTVYGNGPGTVTLAGANTFNGACGAFGGTLSVSSLNYVSSGNLSPNTSSSLGKPSSAANGIITLGNTNISAGTLRYTGTGETTDRQINLGGTTNGATIDQSGTGLLMFTGNFTTLTVGSSVNAQKTLTLQGSTAGTGQIAGNIGDSATGNSGQTATSVTKAGTGTWTLSGANTYSGVTTINAGELMGAIGGSSANSAVSVAATSGNMAVLGVSITNTNNQWTCSSLTVNNGGTTSGLDFNFGALTPGTMVAPLNVSGGVAFSTPSQTTISIESGNLAASAGNGYPLMTWGSGSAPATNGVALTLPNRIAGNLAIAGNTLYLQITGTTEPLSWKGGAGTWDVNNTTNTLWQDNTRTTTYFQENNGLGDSVVFDNTVGFGGTITLNTNVIPASVTVNNSSSATAYTISGSGAIVGGTSVTKSGNGTLTLATTNTYNGGTILNAGTLAANTSVSALGEGSLSLNGGTLDLNNSTSLALGNNATIGGNVAIISENATAGAGVNYTLGTLGIGGSTLTVSGGDVTSGTAGLSFGATTLSGSPTFAINNPTGGGATVLTLGALSDGGSPEVLTVSGNGGLTLAGTGTITAGTALIIGSGTTFTLGGANALGTAAADVSNSGALVLGANQSLRSLTGSGSINLGASILTLNNSGSDTITVGMTGTGGGLTMNGTGTLTLSGANTYTGLTTAKAGTLVLSGPSTATSGVTINGGTSTTVTVNNAGATGSGTLNFATGATTPILQLHLDGGGVIALPNALGGNSGMICTIDVNNNISGSGGIIQLNGGSGVGNITLNVTGGNGYSLYIATLPNTAGSAGTITLNPTTAALGIGSLTASQSSGTARFVLDGTATGNTVTGAITDKAGGGAVSAVTKSDTSTWTLSGTNTYTGPTAVDGGTLLVNGVLGTNTVTVNSTAYFGGTGTVTGAVTYNSGSHAVFTLGSPMVFSNTLTLITNSGTIPDVYLNLPNNLGAGTYTLATYAANGSSGVFDSTTNILVGSLASGVTATISTGGGIVSLVVVGTAPPQPTIAPVTVSGTNLAVSVASASGYNYVLQSTTNLLSPIIWFNESTNAGTGSNLKLNVPIDPSALQKFLRFLVY